MTKDTSNMGEEEKPQNINRSRSPNLCIKSGSGSCLLVAQNRPFIMDALPDSPRDEQLQARSRQRGGGGAEWRWGAGNVEKPVERSAVKDRGSTVGVGVGVGGISHRHRSDSDLFSSRFILTSFASPSLPHTVARVIVQSLGSAGKRNLNRWAPTLISPLWQPQPSVVGWFMELTSVEDGERTQSFAPKDTCTAVLFSH